MVGESQRRLSRRGCPRYQGLDAAAAIEEGEVGMDVEVDEGEGDDRAGGSSIRCAVFGTVVTDVVVAGWDALDREPARFPAVRTSPVGAAAACAVAQDV